MQENQPQDEITLKELMQKAQEWYYFLLSKWKIIVLAAIVGAVLGIGYSFYKKPVYTATLTFAVEEEKAGGGLGSALAGQFGIDLGGGGGGMFAGGNLIELFKSRKMVEKTLLNQDKKVVPLIESYIDFNKLREDWSDDSKLNKIKYATNHHSNAFTRLHDSVLGDISAEIIKTDLTVIQKDKKISIITIEYKSINEDFAKSFTETLVKEVSTFYIETKSKKSKKNLAILMKQTDSIRGELNGAITGVAVATDNTFGLNPALNIKRVPSSRRQVDVQANGAILTELVKQTELAKVTLRKETPLIQVIDAPILPLKTEKFGKAKGIITGGFLAGFLTILGLILRRLLKQLAV
ncbi:MAG: hypothetical protein RLZZ312_1850 [Bacteroidota bacterium]